MCSFLRYSHPDHDDAVSDGTSVEELGPRPHFPLTLTHVLRKTRIRNQNLRNKKNV